MAQDPVDVLKTSNQGIRRLVLDNGLVVLLKQGPIAGEVWHKIGKTVRQLHDAGVYHADLNSHNLLLDKEGKVWVIDFDKGAIRSPGNWQQANLERLLRSFNKESQLHTSFHFVPENWQALMAGYQGKVA